MNNNECNLNDKITLRKNMIGLNLAIKLCQEKNYDVRVIVKDGKGLPLKKDLDRDRFNVHIENNKIVEVESKLY